MSIQVIKQNGIPEYAVLPFSEYLALLEKAETFEDIRSYDDAKNSLAKDDQQIYPASVANALSEGENSIRIWREYRKMTQQHLANEAGISIPYVSQIETGKRKASVKVLKKIAYCLQIDLDDLV